MAYLANKFIDTNLETDVILTDFPFENIRPRTALQARLQYVTCMLQYVTRMLNYHQISRKHCAENRGRVVLKEKENSCEWPRGPSFKTFWSALL